MQYLKNNSSNKENSNNQAASTILTQHSTLEAIKKCGNYKRDKLHRRNYGNIKRLWRTIENTIKIQSDPIGKVVNLSKKTLSKETFQFLNKNLNFVLTAKVYNKHKLNEEMETFYRTIKLKE